MGHPLNPTTLFTLWPLLICLAVAFAILATVITEPNAARGIRVIAFVLAILAAVCTVPGIY
jgi:hypothetical protein